MFLTEVGNNLDREIHLGIFHPPLTGPPDSGRSAAPSFGTDAGVQYMFYEAGPPTRRLQRRRPRDLRVTADLPVWARLSGQCGPAPGG